VRDGPSIRSVKMAVNPTSKHTDTNGKKKIVVAGLTRRMADRGKQCVDWEGSF
jgi:hypothetical protein